MRNQTTSRISLTWNASLQQKLRKSEYESFGKKSKLAKGNSALDSFRPLAELQFAVV